MINLYYRPLQRKTSKERPKGPIIAYDLETTNIPGIRESRSSVEPLYITAYSEHEAFARELRGYADLADCVDHLIRTSPKNARFVAWNANRFDVRLIMAALLYYCTGYTLRAFAAKGGALRGIVVEHQASNQVVYFLDGMNMTGLQCKLRAFLDAYAPDFPKMDLDFSKTGFNPKNKKHVQYAKRDSEGLYYALRNAEKISQEYTGHSLQVTIGNLGIKTFMTNIPDDVQIFPTSEKVDHIVREYVMRGGYVQVARQYDGPAWSYDINQAYAWAMRGTDLPAGRCYHTKAFLAGYPAIYRCTIQTSRKIYAPFYVRDLQGNPVECFGAQTETWITSDEVATLRKYHWQVDVHEGYYWEQSFRMTHFVNRLEGLRKKHPAGTPINLFAKNIGNNAYGKSVEVVPNFSYVLSLEQPEGAMPILNEAGEADMLWALPTDGDNRRPYHRPFLGAFITAAVRCKLFAAIMRAPKAFLKADTDSVTFTKPVALPISKWKYGKWKCESAGDRHIILGKKVYARIGLEAHFVCKGLHVRRLTVKKFERWLRTGIPPMQEQVQLLSWKAGKGLHPIYRQVKRKGTNFVETAPHTIAKETLCRISRKRRSPRKKSKSKNRANIARR
jgi:hypothetical protein